MKEFKILLYLFFVCCPDLYPKTAYSFKNVIVLRRGGIAAPSNLVPTHAYLTSNLYPQFAHLSSTKVRQGKVQLYPNQFKSWPGDGIESRLKSTIVSGPVFLNTGPLTIVDFTRFEPISRPTFELIWV